MLTQSLIPLLQVGAPCLALPVRAPGAQPRNEDLSA